tara:strand:- start:8009 stop:22378 length:14370 start_codon:yes stop_codon:yes gene_type:complete
MSENRVKFSNIVQNQLPAYVRDEFPLVAEFFKSYYQGQEYESGPLDLIQNIDQYVKVQEQTNLQTSVILKDAITLWGETINVDLELSPRGTRGFPETYGLLQIDDEIITYTSKTDSSFTGCIRGFSGVTSYHKDGNPEELVFTDSNFANHKAGATITNLSNLFLKEFLLKTKRQLTPGLSDRELHKDLDQNIFIKHAKDFYLTKGSDKSFEILFKALYNEDVRIVRPKEFLFTPSNANYRITNDLVVEPISGNPLDLKHSTLFQEPFETDINKAYAPITSVEPIDVGFGQTYYKLSIDSGYNRDIRVDGAIYGEFNVSPKTRLIGEVGSGVTSLIVDSTVGFGATGDLYIEYKDGTTGIASYKSKSLNQFFGFDNITGTIANAASIGINTFAYGESFSDPDETIKVRINAVLGKYDIVDNTYYYSKGDTAKIRTLGVEDTEFKFKNWFYNVAPRYKVKSVKLIDASDLTYEIALNVDHYFKLGDAATLIDNNKAKKTTSIISVPSAKSITIRGQGNLDLNQTWEIERNILTVNSSSFPAASLYTSNIQNVYKDKTNLLVASPSLPSYNNQPLDVYSQSVSFTGTYVGEEWNISPFGDHGFYTGEMVYYIPEKINYEYFTSIGTKKTGIKVNSSLFAGDVGYIVTGMVGSQEVENRIPPNEKIYFVSRVDANNIKLALNLTNISTGTFISLDNNTNVTNCQILPFDFRNKTLESQNLLRKFTTPDDDGTLTKTAPGFTGMLINGVQICNYKSRNVINYGKLNKIDVVSPGSDYDIINPPVLSISDNAGIGATGYVAVSGNLKDIRILDSGFDYQGTPVVTITGGNGSGAVASINMKEEINSVSFNAQGGGIYPEVNLNLDTIGFGTYHKFSSGERVVYDTNNQQPIGGITTSSVYYVSLVGLTSVKLHANQGDALIGINTISLTSHGIGKQYINSYDKKSIVEGINVISSGSGYENKKRTVKSATGINTSLNQIVIDNHDYKSGEVINYVETTDTVIGGLTVDTEYYVTAIDDNNFKLSAVGVGTTNNNFYYESQQYIDLTSVGVGTQTFNYPDISVQVIGNVGIASTGTETFECEIQPIFRGEITSVHLMSNGVGYGNSEIINFNREPQVRLGSGQDAQLSPIIANGVITEVVVLKQGEGYNSPPTLTINGDGIGAVITPVMVDNKISDVNVIHGGNGYSPSTTSIEIEFPGSGVEFDPDVQTWTINLFERHLANFTADDGYIPEEFNVDKGLQYSALYAPRKLRESVYATDQGGITLYGDKDLQIVGGKEIESDQHSPILGWAYDGNPIYGPYGYVKRSGGVVAQMKSGYSLNSPDQRPPTSLYPQGFFVEDYVYKEVEDPTVLDENNGRFCITPEFPQGTYAYFTTINNGSADSGGVFDGYKRPIFPYLIGANYGSIPNEFNFSHKSNQNNVNLDNSVWNRNTAPYNLIEGDVEYEYFYIPDKLSQTIDIKSVTPGVIEKVGILTGGVLYQVGDAAVFDNTDTQGYGAAAKVSVIGGKDVETISVGSSIISNVEIYPGNIKGEYILRSQNPHNFKNVDIVNVSGLSTTSSKIGGVYNIGVATNRFTVTGIGTDDSTGIAATATTGFVTFFNVTGDLSYPAIEPNDILKIGAERVKVLNVQPQFDRIRVLRAVDGTIGAAHTVTSILYQDQRRLTINAGFNTTYNSNRNTQIYFNPSETVGLGTTAAVGIGTTISLSNPGTGISEIFVPTKTLYIPGHNLKTNDELTYSPNGGSGLVVLRQEASYPSGISTLSDGDTLYVAKINDTLIGLSSVTVGMGTTGTWVGIATTASSTFFFTGLGTGVYHSLKTNYDPITAELERHLVTVSGGSTHGLTNNDKVTVDVNPGVTTDITLKYNDYSRRLLVNPKSFIASGVNTSTDTFTITNHGFVTGQKVLYTADTSIIEGLQNDGIYYIVRTDENNFKLSDTHYNSTLSKPSIVGVASTASGNINPINPQLKFYKDSTASFDLSDSSLSYTIQGTTYPAFELNFYTDQNFTNLWYKSAADPNFAVDRIGTVGSVGAKVNLTINKHTPLLYYRLDYIYESDLPNVKKEIVVDKGVSAGNEIITTSSLYNGEHVITTTSTTDFTYTLTKLPEQPSYASTISNVVYDTTSTSAFGPIKKFDILNKGSNYYSIPGISTITSVVGSTAVVEPSSTSVGTIKRTEINNIGYNFPSDTTLNPSILLPQIIDIDHLAAFQSIGITSQGRGYQAPPKLLVFDGKTKKQVSNVDIRYKLGDQQVTIYRNPTGLSRAYAPTIIPVENSNGVGISTVGFNTITRDAFVKLGVGFSTENVFPLEVNDKFLIEGISVGVGSTGKNFNSADYNHTLFTVTSLDKNIGGVGATITYSMASLIDEGVDIGTFDAANSSGRIIPEKYFPVFDIQLTTQEYLEGETVTSESASGTVEQWDFNNEILKISSADDFKVGEVIRGESSTTQGTATSIRSFDSTITLDASSKVLHGWETDSGVLNYNMQRVQDSFYYQNFSYALRSRVAEEKWDDVVSSINHTAGFKKFSDYQMETTNENSSMVVGLTTGTTSLEVVTDLIGFGDLNCVEDFDLVTENSLNLPTIVSDEIIFSNRILMDYQESVGNRVLSIDDMSGTFNSSPRATKFSVVDTFKLADVRAQKYITYVVDQRYTQERQLMIVDLLHDGAFGYINQYGRVETEYDQGSFDFAITGDLGQLQWYPNKFSVNDYDITCLSYNLNDNFLGIGTTALSDVAIIQSSSTKVPSATTTTIVGIASTYRSAKILVEITPDASGDGTINSTEWQFDEVNILHDGSNVHLLDYGELITTPGGYSGAGFGTYYPYIDGTDLKVDFVPNAGIGTTCVVNTIYVAIAQTSSGIGTIQMNHALIEARTKDIAASGTPIAVPVAEYSNDYNGAHFLVQVTDTTNNHYQTSEIIVVDNYIEDPSVTVQTYDTEYATINSHSDLGIFSSSISGLGTVSLYFQPNASIAVEVKTYMNALKNVLASKDEIDFTNATIESGFETYTGTERDIKRSFNLTHQNYNIFERYFLANDSAIVSADDNSVTIPNHFWVTGEKITYNHVGTSNSGIGIASTDGFVGVGTTTFLPSEVFVVKVNDDTIKFAETAEKALKVVPETVDITSVGIGTSHRFISQKQNQKVLMALDNIIQSPVVSTAVTTTLSNELLGVQNIAEFSGITSFFGADLIKIDDEIMKIEGVGIGSTNFIRLRREWLGTTLAGHGTDSLVTKVIGNYNIVNNLLTFTEAPYGNVPISSTTNPPDDRDWVGISTGSHFQGRTFMRSGETNSSNESYSENLIFDSLSNQFNGINDTFTLKSNNENVSGIQTDSIILVNDIFQANGSTYQYTIAESSGISSITFTGTATSIASDPGGSNLPMGGVIVSVGSSEGFGYQPLVAAGGTAIVSTAGTVSSISLGYTGSGYRSGIQTVNVAIKTESLTGANIVSIGTASIVDGYITGVAVTNPHVFGKAKSIAHVGYSTAQGLTTVTTHLPHELSLGDEIDLSGIAFTCSYSPRLGITNVGYDTVTGIMTVTTAAAHGYNTTGKTSRVIFTGLAFTCGLDNGESTHYYPRGQDLAYDTAVEVIKNGTLKTVTNAAYNPVTGIMTVTVPSHGLSNGDKVLLENNSIQFICEKDGGKTAHSYPRPSDPIAGQWVTISNKTTNTFRIQVLSVAPSTNVGIHTFVGSTPNGITLHDDKISVNVGYGGPADQFAHTFVGIGTSAVITGGDYTHQFVSAASSAVVTGGNYTHTFVSAVGGGVTVTGIGTTTPTAASYDASTGELVLTVGAGHTYTTDDTVGFSTNAIVFTCSLDGNTSAHAYPRSSDPITGMGVTAITGVGDTTITVNVGSSPLSYYNVSDASYTASTGELALTIGNHSLTGPSTHTVTAAQYNPVSGIMTVFVGTANSFSSGDKVRFDNDSLTFTCALDGHTANKTYPRSGSGSTTDPFSGKWRSISGIGSTSFEVQVLDTIPSSYTGVHTFVSASAGGLHKMGESVKIEQDSLTFRCSMDDYATLHTYPRYSDPGFSTCLGITTVSSNTITLNVGVSTIVKYDVTAADYFPATGIMTMTIGDHTLRKGSSIKIATESLKFTCAKDGGITTHRYPRKPDPTYSGVDVTAVNSTTEFEVNVGPSTVPTFYVGLGSVQGAIMAPRANNFSASKTDPASGGTTVLRVLDNKTFEVNTGVSTLEHFYARGGSLQRSLEVVFDDPTSYSNIPLQYASGYSGIGTAATIDVVVGQGSSIINFRVDETGYGYGNGEFLTVPIGGTTGIPTTSSYSEFLVEITETFNDEFTGWSIGLLQVLDNWDDDFDGDTTTFQLTENGGDLISIRSRKGSQINVQDVLLIWINDILQVPGKGYKFDGGSIVTFTEAPKKDDTSKVIFYKGSGAADVVDREIIETVKKGDTLTIGRLPDQFEYLVEDPRTVMQVDSTDVVSTNPYYGPGNTADESLERPVKWCRQTEDKIINEIPIGKDREHYEPQIHPFAYITKTVGIGSTTIYVDSLRPLFDTYNEKEDKTQLSFQDKVKFIKQETLTGAAGTAIVSAAGTISSIDITEGGVGYSTAVVSIASTVGVGTTTQAMGSVTISGVGTVTGVAITNPGVGYTWTDVPSVLISHPVLTDEDNPVGTYSGDQGNIVGFGTTTIASGTQLIFDLFIPFDSFMRDGNLTGTAVTVSGIGTDDYFVVSNSNMGTGSTSITSLDVDDNTVGIGTSFVDNVYQVNSTEEIDKVIGGGTTTIRRVFVKVDGNGPHGLSTTSGISTSDYMGTYSWGRIDLTSRAGLNSYTAYTQSGITGITTSLIVERFNPLRYKGYQEH